MLEVTTMPTDDTDKACGVHALDPLIHDDCPYCTQIRLAARDDEISRLTTAWHVEMETEAAMRAEVERLRKVETYYRDTIGKCNTHIQEQEHKIGRLQTELFECRRLLSTAEDAWECGAWNSLIGMQQLYLTRSWYEAARAAGGDL